MIKNLKTSFLGTTRKIESAKGGCIFLFKYASKTATDPNPLIIMISPPWIGKNGNKYFTGVNLNLIKPEIARQIIKEFGSHPVGSVSYNDLQSYAAQDPSCCVRTYFVRKVRALHKVGVTHSL